ncbi:MAG: nucleotide exchange factor GrpE [Saccharofermentans sp.]|nr:nucleotide exchange factor GrpE [Saccharofermentans sp.]
MENNDEIFFPQDDAETADDPVIFGDEQPKEELDEDPSVNAEASGSDEDDDEDDSVQDDPSSDREELEARYMSLYAEYENYRKRSMKEKESLYADAVADVTGSFLGIMDNIDRALTTAKGADANSAEDVLKGIEMISKQTADVLTKIGVEEIDCKTGDLFDPELHEAVMHIDDDSLGEGVVSAVFAKGYKYKDKVIRHAVVQVAN